MRILILRLEAPLISFGAAVIDQEGVIQPFPGKSMLTGLIANALGWDHSDHALLARLQSRLCYAARIDRRGDALLDYQTVDLGQPWMIAERNGWTTYGKLAERAGASSEGTHQRYRHFWADSIHTLAISITDDDPVDVETLAENFKRPKRPLFIGRKSCVPSSRIFRDIVEGPSLLQALKEFPKSERADPVPLRFMWPTDDPLGTESMKSFRIEVFSDERDWINQIHTGQRMMCVGLGDAAEAQHGKI